MAINPYSAEHPVPPDKFAGRSGQIDEFSRYLSDTIDGNPKNLAVLGVWGVGKTSLLWTFEDIAAEKGCISATIELGEATDSLVTLFETITQNLATEAAKNRRLETELYNFLNNLSVSVMYGPIGISYAERRNAMPNTLKFRQDLVSIHERVKAPFLVMLDNAEHLINIKGSLLELRNTFQTIQARERVPCMLILSGRETLFSDIHSASEPAARFFWPVGIDPFTFEETQETILKPLMNTNIIFTGEIIREIHRWTNGHPYFVQIFAYVLFDTRKSDLITIDDLNDQYSRILSFVGKKLFWNIFTSASANEKKIIRALATDDRDMLSNTEIAKASGLKSVNVYFGKMTTGNPAPLIRADRGLYSLFHPLFKEYVRHLQSDEDYQGER